MVSPSRASTQSPTHRPETALALCESLLGRGRLLHARVDRATPATAQQVKEWVTAPNAAGNRVDWSQFSTALGKAAPTEPLAVCVISMTEGLYTPPPGQGDVTPVEAIVAIAQYDGKATLYRLGSRVEMLYDTPSSFPSSGTSSNP